jgi:hypothetical protein
LGCTGLKPDMNGCCVEVEALAGVLVVVLVVVVSI